MNCTVTDTFLYAIQACILVKSLFLLIEATFVCWHLFRTFLGMKEMSKWIQQIPLELIFWMGSLIAILTINAGGGIHVSLCPLDNLGFSWCPGCGLGRSMNLLAKGEIQASWSMHPLAMLAFMVIFHRIWTLIKHLKTTHYYG